MFQIKMLFKIESSDQTRTTLLMADTIEELINNAKEAFKLSDEHYKVNIFNFCIIFKLQRNTRKLLNYLVF